MKNIKRLLIILIVAIIIVIISMIVISTMQNKEQDNIVTIDTNPEDATYLAKGGKETKVSKKYKDSIDEFMGA